VVRRYPSTCNCSKTLTIVPRETPCCRANSRVEGVGFLGGIRRMQSLYKFPGAARRPRGCLGDGRKARSMLPPAFDIDVAQSTKSKVVQPFGPEWPLPLYRLIAKLVAMSKMIFVSLPVADLAKSKAFYEAIGAKNNPQFSGETAACMVFSDTISVMLQTHEKWTTFTKKAIADAHRASEVMLAISCDDRHAVDQMKRLPERKAERLTSTRNRISGSCTTAASRTQTDTSGKRFLRTCLKRLKQVEGSD
jgi:predicted lactoylglutathione lyase